MQANSTKQLLTSAYEAFNRQDIDAVLATTHVDVDWAIGMNARLRGHEKIRSYWQRRWTKADFKITPLMFVGSERDRQMVVDVHQVARNFSGKIIRELILQHVFFIRGGLIERMDNRESELADPL